MKTISANFQILDNSGKTFSSSIRIENPETSLVMNEIKSKISSVYNVSVDQIKSIGNIQTS